MLQALYVRIDRWHRNLQALWLWFVVFRKGHSFVPCALSLDL